MSFRDNLRETLEFSGMEQKELAAKTGISLKTIENYVKKDSSIPSADKAVLIAHVLGVSVEYLMNGKKQEKADCPAVQPQHKEIVEKYGGLFSSRHYLPHKVTITWNSHISVVLKSPMIGILANAGKVCGNGILFPGGRGRHKRI
jgi:transcriptional regulator with XRE-family HTH domain